MFGPKNTLQTLLMYHDFPKGGPTELITDRKGSGVAGVYVPSLERRCQFPCLGEKCLKQINHREKGKLFN